MPANWATTQNNLGSALASLGDCAGGEPGLAALNEAVAAHRAALEVHTRETMPANWVSTTENLAHAEASVAIVTNDLALIHRAIDRMEEVIADYQAMQADYYIDKAQRNLAWMREVLDGMAPPSAP